MKLFLMGCGFWYFCNFWICTGVVLTFDCAVPQPKTCTMGLVGQIFSRLVLYSIVLLCCTLSIFVNQTRDNGFVLSCPSVFSRIKRTLRVRLTHEKNERQHSTTILVLSLICKWVRVQHKKLFEYNTSN